MVTLVQYGSEYLDQLMKIELTEEQQKFTQTAVEVLATLKDPDRKLVLIKNDDDVVGYFILHGNQGVTDLGFEKDALLIRSLAIDPSQARRGFSYQGMAQLPEFIKMNYNDINRLVLIVNKKNIPAQGLYKKLGFTQHSSRENPVHGTQFIYELELSV